MKVAGTIAARQYLYSAKDAHMFSQHAFIATYGQQKSACNFVTKKLMRTRFCYFILMTDNYYECKFKNNRLKRALGFLVHVSDSKLLHCEINLIL